MALPENEVAAENQRRMMEELSKSSVGGIVENAINLARPTLTVGSALVASGTTSATGLAVAGGVVAGLGVVDWFRKLGSSKVNENLEALGRATEDALNRVERVLLEHGTSIGEIEARIESQGFKDGMASAALQALRTTQKERLGRMALILANSVNANDSEPEGLDDMMRAAAELKEEDLEVLKTLCASQIELLRSLRFGGMDWLNGVRQSWSKLEDEKTITLQNFTAWRSSLARLQMGGLVESLGIGSSERASSPWIPQYALLPEGVKFYERMQEVGV